MPQRILHIIPSLGWGGAQRQLSLLAAGQVQRGLDVHVCSLTTEGATAPLFKQAGITVHSISRNWPRDLDAFHRLQQQISDLRPDVVQTWLPAANSWGRAAALRAGAKRIIATLTLPNDERNLLERVADRQWLDRRTSAFVASSPHVRLAWIERGLPAEKIAVIAPGVAAPLPSPVSRDQLLAHLGLPPDALLAGTAGPLVGRKRVKELVWGADQINVLRGGQAHLLLFGDGPMRLLVERYRRLFHIANNVHLLGWREDFLQLLPHLDLFWSASASEGVPMSLLEAMAAGVPVVATDIPAHRQLITPSESGYLTNPKIRSDFTRYSDWILSDPAKTAAMREAARRRSEGFSVAAMIEAHDQLYG